MKKAPAKFGAKGSVSAFGTRVKRGNVKNPSCFSRAERIATMVRKGSERAELNAKRANDAVVASSAAAGAFAIGGSFTAAAIAVTAGQITKAGLRGLSNRAQRNFVVNVLGRPKLAKLVADQISDPVKSANVRTLGTIYLGSKARVALREKISRGKFNFNTFRASLVELMKLGELRADNKKLTDEITHLCLKGHKAELEPRLKPQARNALKLAIRLIGMVEELKIKPRTMRSIITQVFALKEIPRSEKDSTIIYLAKRATDSPEKKVVTDFLREHDIHITMEKRPRGAVAISVDKN